MYDTLLDEFMNAATLAEAQKQGKKRNFILKMLGLFVAILGAVAAIISAIK